MQNLSCPDFLRRAALGSAAFFLFGLSSCEEKRTPVDLFAVVDLSDSSLANRIDWNREMALAESSEVYERAAAAVGIDPATLKSVITIEADLTERKIRFVSSDSEKEASAMADAFRNLRSQFTAKQLHKKITELEAQLKEQSAEFNLNPDPLSHLIEANGEVSARHSEPQQSALEQDRMTYDKAKKALEEDPE